MISELYRHMTFTHYQKIFTELRRITQSIRSTFTRSRTVKPIYSILQVHHIYAELIMPNFKKMVQVSFLVKA